MKSRMDKYHSKTSNIPKRETKNCFLYDEIYENKRESENNITLSDNAREIDINKIKEILNDRENYKRRREYNEIIGEKKEIKEKTLDYKEPDERDYDINELIKRKKDGLEEADEKIRKISNTQYDILKGLSLKEISADFFDLERELNTLVKSKTFEEEKTIDLFNNLKGDNTEELTPAIEKKELEVKKSSFNTFEFDKEDFEDINVKKTKMPFALKITLIFLGSIILVSLIFFLLSKFMGS